VLFYLHMASDGRVPVRHGGKVGDPIGHPSCEGGFFRVFPSALARKYNGEWIAAGGPLPFVCRGWQAHSSGADYDGSMTGVADRHRRRSWNPQVNGLTARLINRRTTDLITACTTPSQAAALPSGCGNTASRRAASCRGYPHRGTGAGLRCAGRDGRICARPAGE